MQRFCGRVKKRRTEKIRSSFFTKQTARLLSTVAAEAEALQVTPLKLPYGTRAYPFSAASFPI